MDDFPALHADREHPFVVEHDDRTFKLRALKANVSSAPGPAISSNPFWEIEVDGVRRGGWESRADESADEVKRHLAEWWEAEKANRVR
jgi:hypothetical protein